MKMEKSQDNICPIERSQELADFNEKSLDLTIENYKHSDEYQGFEDQIMP